MNFIPGFRGETVLFDLDGTLLPMDMNEFEKEYFSGLCRRMASRAKPEEMYQYIWGGTRAMVENDGQKTNREVFRDYLNENTPLNYDVCEPEFLDFYQNDFQSCVRICHITDLSKKIVAALRGKGYTVAIATNPIFPQVATYSRLRWLDMDPESFPLVTTFENSHFAKPNPSYYKEVCEKLGVRPEDCVMVGNDVVEDGIAASLGMRVILIEDFLLHREKLSGQSFETGSLAAFYEWVQALPECRGN